VDGSSAALDGLSSRFLFWAVCMRMGMCAWALRGVLCLGVRACVGGVILCVSSCV
jgi:hypothetical protein